MVVYFCLRCKFRLLLPHGQIIRFFLHKRWVLGYEMRKKEEKRCENGEFREGKDDFDLKKRYKRMETEYFFVTLPCRMRRLLVYGHGPILFRHTPNHSWHDAGRGAKTDEPAKPTAGSTLPHTTLPYTEFLPRACPQPGISDTTIDESA